MKLETEKKENPLIWMIFIILFLAFSIAYIARAEVSVNPSSSGGSGQVFTNSSNIYTFRSTNTFNGPTTTSNLFVRGNLFVNTNGMNPFTGITSTPRFFISPLNNIPENIIGGINAGGLGNNGDWIVGADADHYILRRVNGSGNPYDIIGPYSNPAYALEFTGSTNMFSATPTTQTFGHNSGTLHTFNGTTYSFPNNANFNSDTLWFNASKNAAIGTNTTADANLTIQGPSSGAFTNQLIRLGSTQTGFAFMIQGTNGSAIASLNFSGSSFQIPQSTITLASQSTVSGTGMRTGGSGPIFGPIASVNTSINFRSGTNSNNAVVLESGNPGINSAGLTNGLVVSSAGVAIGQGYANPVPISLSGYTNFPATPGTIAAQTPYVTNMSVAGILVGADVHATMSVARSGLVPSAQCTNNGVATVFINNYSASGIDPGTPTIYVRFFQP